MANSSTTKNPISITVKPAWYWIKDTSGEGSVTVTMLFVAFWVTTIAYVLSVIDHIGSVSIRTFDVGACSAYFIPILTLYFGRKWTDSNAETEIVKSNNAVATVVSNNATTTNAADNATTTATNASDNAVATVVSNNALTTSLQRPDAPAAR